MESKTQRQLFSTLILSLSRKSQIHSWSVHCWNLLNIILNEVYEYYYFYKTITKYNIIFIFMQYILEMQIYVNIIITTYFFFSGGFLKLSLWFVALAFHVFVLSSLSDIAENAAWIQIRPQVFNVHRENFLNLTNWKTCRYSWYFRYFQDILKMFHI